MRPAETPLYSVVLSCGHTRTTTQEPTGAIRLACERCYGLYRSVVSTHYLPAGDPGHGRPRGR